MKKILKIILCFVSILAKHLQSNRYQDLFFEMCRMYKNKIRLFSTSVKFWYRFVYKTMTKQTEYERFRNKEQIQIAISEAICLLNSPLLERSDDLSNYYISIYTRPK